jgi:AcrR family transcriptional regulator
MVSNLKTKNAVTRGSAGRKTTNPMRRPGRPVSDHKFDGREVLLTTAHQLLIESHGLPVSMNYICARAGINQAMVRYHFGGKHELMVALFERVAETWSEPLQELLDLDIDPRKKLEIHIRQIIQNFRAYPYISRLMTELQLTADPNLQKRLSNSFVDKLLALYKHVTDEGTAKGVLRPVEPLHLFLSIVGLCDYIFAAQPMLEAGLGVKMTDKLEQSLIDHTTSLVLDGISARP